MEHKYSMKLYIVLVVMILDTSEPSSIMSTVMNSYTHIKTKCYVITPKIVAEISDTP